MQILHPFVGSIQQYSEAISDLDRYRPAFVNRIWPTLILRFGPPAGPTVLPCPALLFSVAPAGAKPSAAAFAARLGEA